MKALITGIAGFVGSTLALRLLRDGYEVVGVDSLTDYYDKSLKEKNLALLESGAFGSRLTVLRADLRDLDLSSLLADVDYVFHQAGQPGVRKSWGRDFSFYIDSNIDLTQQLLEAARTAPQLKRLVYASSSSVYGDAETYPTLETLRPQPRSPYGVTKLAAEHLCILYAENFGVPTASLRYFTVYGPRQRPDMAFTRFLRAIKDGQPITLFGDGEQIRDFTFVDDIVEANVRAAESDSLTNGAVLNVCGGSSVSVNEVLDIMRDVSGRDVLIDRYEAVAGDVRRTGGDSHRIRQALGWRPQVQLEDGIARQWAWILESDG